MWLHPVLPTFARPIPLDPNVELVLIGKHPQCDVVLRDPSISRRHCCLTPLDTNDGPVLLVKDLGTGRIAVNGFTVGKARLAVGDALRIGDLEFILRRDYGDGEPDA